MGVATSLSRVAPQRDRFSESLRRGGRSSCLHVHVPLAHVARGSDPCLQRLSLQLRARTFSPAAPGTTTTTHTHNNLLPLSLSLSLSLSSFQKAPLPLHSFSAPASKKLSFSPASKKLSFSPLFFRTEPPSFYLSGQPPDSAKENSLPILFAGAVRPPLRSLSHAVSQPRRANSFSFAV